MATVAEKGSAMEPYALLKTRCYVCHMPDSPSHDSIIAPPMQAVKQRYLMRYPDEEDFVRAMVAWAHDPRADKSIMPGAVSRYQLMPKQNFKEEELQQIASYIYANELEQPEWFDDHEKEMRNFGRMGMGRGSMN